MKLNTRIYEQLTLHHYNKSRWHSLRPIKFQSLARLSKLHHTAFLCSHRSFKLSLLIDKAFPIFLKKIYADEPTLNQKKLRLQQSMIEIAHFQI